MTAEMVLAELLRINVVASVAVLAVLLLRPLALRRLGARVTYWLWLVVPVTAAISAMPARERIVPIEAPASIAAAEVISDSAEISPAAAEKTPDRVDAMRRVSLPKLANVLIALWLLGAAILLARSIQTTRRLAAEPSLGPALIGVLRPRLVLPEDFESRFDAQERAVILAHEQVHRSSGHPLVNALVEVVRCLNWFNPLVHLAAIRFRADQELACDAAVIATRPADRRIYAQALLKTQIAPAFLPLGCTWTSRSAERLRERIAMLRQPLLSRRGAYSGALAIACIGSALGYVAWAQQPERLVTDVARPEAVWTPSTDAPAGTLSHALEGRRHDLFIDLAQKGGIDLVFFGATTTEMWSWAERGKTVWDRELAPLKATNFGAQGTRPDSLVWRMQNGELAGYQAKLVVLHAFSDADRPMPSRSRFPDWNAGYAAVIAEIRARQPQAKILIFAAFHREQTLRQWQEVAAANAAVFADLVDEQTVFYDDYGERFYRPDGSFKPDMWRSTEPDLYEMWAEELQPWLDRFVR